VLVGFPPHVQNRDAEELLFFHNIHFVPIDLSFYLSFLLSELFACHVHAAQARWLPISTMTSVGEESFFSMVP
jgi:hypothetical protein